MRFNLRREGLFNPTTADMWIRSRRIKLRQGVIDGFKEAGPQLRQALQEHLRAVLKVRKASFARVMAFKVYAKDATRMPSMAVGALHAHWLESQAGATIRGHGKGMLIPFGNLRMGKKTFRNLIAELMRAGNAYFRVVNGRPILFAERLRGKDNNRRTLRRFLKGAEKGATDIPIAVLVKSVTLKPRLKVGAVVEARLGLVATAIERNMHLNTD